MGFQKPNNLEYRNLMDTHGESLLNNEDASEIVALVNLQRLAEKISAFHRGKDLETNDAVTAEMNAQIFQSELENWKNYTPVAVKSLRMSFTLSFFCHS